MPEVFGSRVAIESGTESENNAEGKITEERATEAIIALNISEAAGTSDLGEAEIIPFEKPETVQTDVECDNPQVTVAESAVKDRIDVVEIPIVKKQAYIPKVKDIVTFGRYYQDGNKTEGKKPIEWIVLDVKGENALLISKYAIENKPYHEEWESITWEKCTLRQWLNNDFLKVAFYPIEQKGIVGTKVINKNNPLFGTPGGNTTKDYIFCLSIRDAEKYFENDEERICFPIKYCNGQSETTSDSGRVRW